MGKTREILQSFRPPGYQIFKIEKSFIFPSRFINLINPPLKGAKGMLHSPKTLRTYPRTNHQKTKSSLQFRKTTMKFHESSVRFCETTLMINEYIKNFQGLFQRKRRFVCSSSEVFIPIVKKRLILPDGNFTKKPNEMRFSSISSGFPSNSSMEQLSTF